jgi:hypothetical protein
MMVSNTGVVTWTPAESVTTSGEVTLTVTDGDDQSDSQIFSITVTLVNDAPVITSKAPTTAYQRVEYTYVANVIDPDDDNDGDGLAWSLSNEPDGMVVSSTGVVTWTPGIGITTTGEVTLIVEDGKEDDATPATETFSITVSSRWSPAPLFPLFFSVPSPRWTPAPLFPLLLSQ